jgi:hypothetical protein
LRKSACETVITCYYSANKSEGYDVINKMSKWINSSSASVYKFMCVLTLNCTSTGTCTVTAIYVLCHITVMTATRTGHPVRLEWSIIQIQVMVMVSTYLRPGEHFLHVRALLAASCAMFRWCRSTRFQSDIIAWCLHEENLGNLMYYYFSADLQFRLQ